MVSGSVVIAKDGITIDAVSYNGSNEGIRHKTKPWFSAQFHPEAASGPTDTEFLFDEFVKLL